MNTVTDALRLLRRHPASTAAAILIAGAGIGATTAMFSVVDSVVLEPLPVRQPDRLVRLEELTPGGEPFTVSAPNFIDFAGERTAFEGLAAASSQQVTLQNGEPTRIDALAVTQNWFTVLGASPRIGRAFDGTASDFNDAIIVSSALAERALVGDASIGKSVIVDGAVRTVIGIMPPLAGVSTADAWLPFRADAAADRSEHDLFVIGRLADGASPAAATGALAAIAARLGEAYPETNGGWSVRLTPLADVVVGPETRHSMWLLLAAVGVLLLLTSVNLSGLLLARSYDRGPEFGVRMALGAGRGRIVGQVLTESLVLAGCGTIVGGAFAFWLVPVLRRIAPPGTPRIEAAGMDATAFAAATLLALVSGVLFGLMPALWARRATVATSLRRGARTTVRAGRTLRLIAAAETALAVVLLVAAGLLVTSFLRLEGVDPGYAKRDILVAPLALTTPRFQNDGGAGLMRLVDEVRATPGIVAAGATNVAPFGEWNTVVDLSAEGRPSGPGETSFARWRAVTPGYFEAAGLRLVAGRFLEPADARADAEAVVVVTRSFVERIFPRTDPLGQRVAMGVNGDNWRRVVGVVDDIEDRELGAPAQPVFFFPYDGDWPWMALVVRTADGAAAAGAIRGAIARFDPSLPVPTIEPLSASIRRATALPRFRVRLVVAFAAAAVLLAALGLYGVMSYVIRRRTREIGIRLALGAMPGRINRLVLRDGGRIALAGFVVGAVASLAVARALRPLLFHTSAFEPAVYGAVIVLLGVLTLAATLPAARRAMRVDPAITLKEDA